jgi:hypothetical protein
MLGNMRCCHRLTFGMRGKERRAVLFHIAGAGVSGKRSSAYIGHPKHACVNPGPGTLR